MARNFEHGYTVYGDVNPNSERVLSHAVDALNLAGVGDETLGVAARMCGMSLETMSGVDCAELGDRLTVCADREGLREFLGDYGDDDAGSMSDDALDSIAGDLGGYPVVVASAGRLDEVLEDHESVEA